MKFPAFEPINLKNNVQSFEAIDINLSQIEPDKNQPRKIFTDHSLEELAASIKQHGVIQPIIVRDINKGKYQIIAGERRWRAAKIVGLEKIPAIIREYDKANRMAVSLIENIQRENLNPLEEAQAIQNLLEECYMTHSQVAESLGRSRTTVSNLLRLLTLTSKVKEMINLKLLEMGHARALLSLSSDQQIETAEQIVNKSLSVRETEKLVQRINVPKQKHEVFLVSQVEEKAKKWNIQLAKQFPAKANVDLDSSGKGKVIIQFESLDEADWLINHLTKTL